MTDPTIRLLLDAIARMEKQLALITQDGSKIAADIAELKTWQQEKQKTIDRAWADDIAHRVDTAKRFEKLEEAIASARTWRAWLAGAGFVVSVILASFGMRTVNEFEQMKEDISDVKRMVKHDD